MKKNVKGVLVLVTMMAIISCKKGDVSSEDCQTCEGPNVVTFNVCEEDDKIFVDGEEIKELEGISLGRVISELEANEENEEKFENLSCR